jgi:hypothetical protein
VHLHDLRRVLDRQAAVGAAETVTFIRKKLFVADEDDLNIEFLCRLKGALDAGGWTMVSTHGVESNFHSSDILTRGAGNPRINLALAVV